MKTDPIPRQRGIAVATVLCALVLIDLAVAVTGAVVPLASPLLASVAL